MSSSWLLDLVDTQLTSYCLRLLSLFVAIGGCVSELNDDDLLELSTLRTDVLQQQQQRRPKGSLGSSNIQLTTSSPIPALSPMECQPSNMFCMLVLMCCLPCSHPSQVEIHHFVRTWRVCELKIPHGCMHAGCWRPELCSSRGGSRRAHKQPPLCRSDWQ